MSTSPHLRHDDFWLTEDWYDPLEGDDYTNGDADEDAEAGVRGDDAGFYVNDGA